jgi:hypothetical protein
MSDKKILPHSLLKELAPNLWILEGKLPHSSLPRTMTILRLEDHSLVIHSAIAVEDSVLKDISALGNPTHLIVPNSMHRLDAAFYKEKFPQIRVVCPAAAVEKVSKEVVVDGTCEEEFQGNKLQAMFIPGIKNIELAYEFALPEGKSAIVLNDIIVNVKKLRGVSGWLLDKMGRIGRFRTPPVQKLLFIDDKEALKEWYEKLAQRKNIGVVTLAHGEPVTENISYLFHHAAQAL